MTSSFTDYRGHGFWARDARLAAWLRQLVHAIDRWPDRPAWLREARDDWHLQATAGFMGCVSASLDTWRGTDPDRVAAVAALSAEALREARATTSARSARPSSTCSRAASSGTPRPRPSCRARRPWRLGRVS